MPAKASAAFVLLAFVLAWQCVDSASVRLSTRVAAGGVQFTTPQQLQKLLDTAEETLRSSYEDVAQHAALINELNAPADEANAAAPTVASPVDDPVTAQAIADAGLDPATGINPLSMDETGVFASADSSAAMMNGAPGVDLDSAVDEVIAKARHAVTKGHTQLRSQVHAAQQLEDVPDPFAAADAMLKATVLPATPDLMRFQARETQTPPLSSDPNATATPAPVSPTPTPQSPPVVVTTNAQGEPIHIVVASDRPSLAPSPTEMARNQKTTPALQMSKEELERRIKARELVEPLITRYSPANLEDAAAGRIRLISPLPLIKPVVVEPQVPCPNCKPEMYDPLANAQEALDRAKRRIQNVGWAADTLGEPKHPSAHLIQQSIANFKKVEAADLGSVAPGDKLTYDHKIELEQAILKSQAHRAYIDSLTNTNNGIISTDLEKLAIPRTPMWNDTRKHLGELLQSGANKRREEMHGPQRIVVAKALEKLGGVVDMLAHRLAALDVSEDKLFARLFGAKAGTNASLEDVERRMIAEKAQEIKERREGEIAALVRDEVRILTNQMRTELDLLRSRFFSEIRELLYQLRESLKSHFLRSRERDDKVLQTALSKLGSPGGLKQLVTILTMKPAQEKERIIESIDQVVDKAWSSSQNLVRRVWASRAQEVHSAEEKARNAENYHHEPSQAELERAIARQAEEARETMRLTQEAREKTSIRKHIVSKAKDPQLSIRQARELRRKMETIENDSSIFADDMEDRKEVRQAERRAAQEATRRQRESEKLVSKLDTPQQV